MLLDEGINLIKMNMSGVQGRGKIVRHTFAHKLSAKRFRFVDETCRAIGGLLKDYPDILLRNYQFALPPFPITYAECDFYTLLEAIGRTTTATFREDGARQVGYLSANGILTSVCKTKPEISIEVSPTMHAYTIDASPLPPAYRPPGCGEVQFREPWGKAVVALGSTLTDGNPTQDQIQGIDDMVRVWVEQWVLNSWSKHADYLRNFVGDVRNFWAMMLWLNQPGHVVYEIQPRRRAMTRRGPIVYQEHTVVRLRPGVDYHHVAVSYFKRATPGAHDVRPTFRNYEKDPNCSHDWPIWPDDEGKWKCNKCTQWRVYVSRHRRGDETRPVKRVGYEA